VLLKRRIRTTERDESDKALVLDYRMLRTAIGAVTALLPLLLVLSAAANSEQWPESLSGYYYTVSRNLLVGALCAIGVFLVAYMGYDPLDRCVTVIAGVCAIGVAFFPTSRPSFQPHFIGIFHQVFSTGLMVAMGIMALQFTRTGSSKGQMLLQQLKHLWNAFCGKVAPTREDAKAATQALAVTDPDAELQDDQRKRLVSLQKTIQKRLRNRVYVVCSRLILLLIAFAYIQNFIPVHWHLFFWCEVGLLETFAVAWFVKGGLLLLRDPRDVWDESAPRAVAAA